MPNPYDCRMCCSWQRNNPFLAVRWRSLSLSARLSA